MMLLAAFAFSLFASGCQPPCEQLAIKLCNGLKTQQKLCAIAKEECKRSTSSRQCRALLATWDKTGSKQVRAFAKRYRAYHDWISRTKKMKKGLELLAKERRAFRAFMQQLLGNPSTQPPKRRSSNKNKTSSQKSNAANKRKARKARKK
jgi:hypothetical protein